jgi:predicted transcriptional regulator
MSEGNSELRVNLPNRLASQLDDLARETGRSRAYHVEMAIVEYLEERAAYEQAVATLAKGEPRLTLDEARHALGLED